MTAAETNQEQLDTDSLMADLEQRVVALEAVSNDWVAGSR